MSAAVRKAIATFSLLIFVGSLGLASLPGEHVLVGLDADCASPLVVGHRTPGIDSARDTRASSRDHCVLCHWLRAVHNAKPVLIAVSSPSLVAGERPHIIDRRIARDQARSDAPSRAPPQPAFVTL